MRCLWPGTRPRAKVPDLVAGKGGQQRGKRCQLEVRLAGKIHISTSWIERVATPNDSLVIR